MATNAPTTTHPLIAGSWALDPHHTTVGFTIRHLGVSKVRGRFDDVTAELTVAPMPEESTLTATVGLASIDTGNRDRDDHLRSNELLDVEARPTMTFRSTRVQGHGEDWTIDGNLTIGDTTNPVTLTVELGGVEDFFDGTRHAGFEATTEISRRDYGLGFGPLGAMLGDTVKIELDLQFIEPS